MSWKCHGIAWSHGYGSFVVCDCHACCETIMNRIWHHVRPSMGLMERSKSWLFPWNCHGQQFCFQDFLVGTLLLLLYLIYPQYPVRYIIESFQGSWLIALVIGLVHSSTTWTPWGAYSPGAFFFFKALATIQTCKQLPSNQVPIHSWVDRECTCRWSVSPKDTAPHCSSQDPYQRPLRP